jgi:long-chain acyl-CoA synthetase
MRSHLATLLDDFRKMRRETAVVSIEGNRRRSTSYGELATQAARFAALLVEHGIGRGERILLWAENSAEWIEAFYGAMMRGVVVVPLDAMGATDFAARVARDVQPKIIVGDANLLARLPADLNLPTLALDDWETALPINEAGTAEGLGSETVLEILFTSGTTGEPKGVVLTHGNVLASVWPIERGARPYMRYLRIIHPLRIMHTLPLSHVFGQTMGLWVPPLLHAEVHFENRLVAPGIVERIRRERISVLAAVPRVHALVKTYFEGKDPNLASQIEASEGMRAWRKWWRFRKIHRALGIKFWALVSGGGALTGSVEKFWNALGLVVIQGYGMTESTALITLNHPFHVARGTIGKPMPGREVKLGADGEVLVKGRMISSATWSDGQLHQREDEWLSTGDLAERLPTGELRFLGRKSEVIVTAAGVNLHPEDLEAAFEEEPEVASCAVVAIEGPAGPEACAVFALRGDPAHATAIVERANSRLAEFQRLRYWRLWPEPDLPRTSTGKVKRKAVAEWLAHAVGTEKIIADGQKHEGTDWLLALITEITGERVTGGDELRLTEDLRIDSLGRVQLAAALEERLGLESVSELLDASRTLGELRQNLVTASSESLHLQAEPAHKDLESTPLSEVQLATIQHARIQPRQTMHHIYPRWPWLLPIRILRACFLELVVRPLVWFLAAPRINAEKLDVPSEPMIIISNHITIYDGPLVEYALPWRLRRSIAVAMSGEMLHGFRHFKNFEKNPQNPQFDLFGPLFYYLLTALFNVFPLSNGQDFQQSFAHAGKALDHGYNVLIFPEGSRSKTGQMAHFRKGIGVLVKQSGAKVLPVALKGLGTLSQRKKGWIRSGILEVRIGKPVRFASTVSEAAINEALENTLQELLNR